MFKNLNNYIRFFNTVKYLKLKQIYWRLFKYINLDSFQESYTFKLRRPINEFKLTPAKAQSLFEGDQFLFLNEKGKLSEIGWLGKEKSYLWKYNLHYFDDLNAINAIQRISWHTELVLDWVRSNISTNSLGWEPYPTSLRIVNWIKWDLKFGQLPEVCKTSLLTQARWLNQNLEWHLLGNHILANAKALIFAGLYFEGKEADKLLKKGLKILLKELDEQILNDGGHFELSPMYHSIILEDLLDIINLSQCYDNVELKKNSYLIQKIIKKMFFWLNTMCHPDTEISYFNDSAFNIATPFPNLLKYYKSIFSKSPQYQKTNKKLELTHLAATGFIRLENRNATALFDVGEVGASYIPGHAHADTLSFELSIFGRRLIINTGTSTYENCKDRHYERSTAAHNTVEINKKNSSDVWHSFRVGKRASPFNLEKFESLEFIGFSCSHNGFVNFRNNVTHERTVILNNHSLKIIDEIMGTNASGKARLFFHPEVCCKKINSRKWLLRINKLKKSVNLEIFGGKASLLKSYYCTGFGHKVVNWHLEIEFQNDPKIETILSWH